MAETAKEQVTNADEVMDLNVKSVLDNGQEIDGWKGSIARVIEEVPDTLLGLITVFMTIGTALEHFIPKGGYRQ